MPKRTNDFQKLVKIINSHLAPSGAKITESAMLFDHEAETDREVDILVETEFMNCVIKIGIECTAKRSPLDTKAIEGFKEKHRKLGINQTVVVAKHGFYSTAKTYAAKNNIKLLTFSAAKKQKWSALYEHLKGLAVYARTYTLKSIILNMADDAVRTNFTMSTSVQVMLKDGPIFAPEFAAKIFNESRISEQEFKRIKEHEENSSDPWIEVGFSLGGNIEFKDPDGHSVWPQEMIVRLGYRSNYRDLNVGEVSYDGRDLVAGGFLDKNSGENAYVAIEKGVDGGVAGTLEFSDTIFPRSRRAVVSAPSD